VDGGVGVHTGVGFDLLGEVMKSKSLAAIVALLFSLLMPMPASANGLLCETKSSDNPFCNLNAADISNDGKFLFAVEQIEPEFEFGRGEFYDVTRVKRIVKIEIATKKVTELAAWTQPADKIADAEIGKKFVDSSWSGLDLSPDGKHLLIQAQLMAWQLVGRNPDSYDGVDVTNEVVGTELQVMNLKTLKITNLSKTLKLDTPVEIDGVQKFQWLTNPTWSSNSKEVRFTKMDQKDKFSQHTVAISSPTKLRSFKLDVRITSAGSRFATQSNPITKKPHFLFDLRKNRRVGEIRGTADFADYRFDIVLPKDSGKEFFASAYQSNDEGEQVDTLFQIDSKGKRKVLFPEGSKLGLIDLRYAEKGKKLLIQTATKGYAIITG
jgi:hypothetical protein